MQFGDNAGPDQPAHADQGLHCQLAESVDTLVYVDEQNVQIRLHGRAGLWHKGLFPSLHIMQHSLCLLGK